MTKYKEGDRVRVVSVDEIHGVSHLLPLDAEGVVFEIHPITGYARVKCGYHYQWVEDGHIELITDPAPLRFSDVRTGDTITVETGRPGVTLITGIAEVNEFTGEVRIPGLGGWFWHDETTPYARLTAHTPAEPEWHRAKVIMGCYTEAGTPEEPEYWLLGRDGLFYSVSGAAEDYELTNVTIIVDEHGRVPAETAAPARDERKETH